MTRQEQIAEVAGHLNVAGCNLRRAVEAAERHGMQEEVHGLAQFQFAVQAYAEGWNARCRRMGEGSLRLDPEPGLPSAAAEASRGPTEWETLERLNGRPRGGTPGSTAGGTPAAT